MKKEFISIIRRNMNWKVQNIAVKLSGLIISATIFLYIFSSMIFGTIEDFTGITIQPHKFKRQIFENVDTYLQDNYDISLKNFGINIKERHHYFDPDLEEDVEDLSE